MSEYERLKREFIDTHSKADEFITRNDGTPVAAIYLAPDPNVDYDELNELLSKINATE